MLWIILSFGLRPSGFKSKEKVVKLDLSFINYVIQYIIQKYKILLLFNIKIYCLYFGHNLNLNHMVLVKTWNFTSRPGPATGKHPDSVTSWQRDSAITVPMACSWCVWLTPQKDKSLVFQLASESLACLRIHLRKWCTMIVLVWHSTEHKLNKLLQGTVVYYT